MNIKKMSHGKRAVRFGKYMVKHSGTVRSVADHYGIGKSTVHKDLTRYLMEEDSALYKKVVKLMKKNNSEKHIRGGNATKKKFAKLRKLASA